MRKTIIAKLLIFALAVTGLSLVVPNAALAAAVDTTTTLTVDPPSPQPEGASLTLTATITPTAAQGQVHFFYDNVLLQGDPTVKNGKASTTIGTAGGVKTHKLRAEFTPSDTAAYGPSQDEIDYTLTANPRTTTTKLTVSPDSPTTEDVNPTLTATVTPSTATGTVTFFDGEDAINFDPEPVSNGTAAIQTSLDAGTHQLSAVFTPDEDSNLDGSTSNTVSYVVEGAPEPTQTTTGLTVTPTSPAAAGSTQTLTATVSPAAAGTVTFKDGTSSLGSSPVSGGQATLQTKLPSGNHSLTATFTPSDSTAYKGSTSDALAYTVSAAAKPTSVSLGTPAPTSPQQAGTSVTFTASVTPGTAEGTVQFKDGSNNIGDPATVTNGSAQVATTSLTKGSHSITAVFTPSNSDLFDPSMSNPITYVIAGYPSPPTGITATPGNQSATVSWTAPTDNGGSPITGYVLEQSTNGEDWVATQPGGTRTSTSTSKTVTGLTNGTGYLFRVAAINAIGTGSFDATETKVVPFVNSTTVTISAPKNVAYNGTATVTTTVTDGQNKPVASATAQLYRRVAGASTYTLYKSVSTSSTGTASVNVTAMTANTMFQWKVPAKTGQPAGQSTVATTGVSLGLTSNYTPKSIKSGGTVKFWGAVSPALVGKPVYLQYYGANGWTTRYSIKLAKRTMPDGRTYVGYLFAFGLASRGSYTFRIYVTHTDANDGVVSANLPLTVT